MTTERTIIRRRPERGMYDAGTIHSILDAALICHLGFVVTGGYPSVIPTIHARSGDRLYVHGSVASRALRTLAGGVECCVTATVVDGIVFAKSAFHHTMNYRSVVVYGAAQPVVDDAEKLTALRALSDHVAPGRWDDARPPTDAELKQTNVLALSLAEASAKVRTGPALDDADDERLPVWAGVLPVRLVASGDPLPAATSVGAPVPSYVTSWDTARPV